MTNHQSLVRARKATAVSSRGLTTPVGATVPMTRRYEAGITEVWDAWTNQERTTRWLGLLYAGSRGRRQHLDGHLSK